MSFDGDGRASTDFGVSAFGRQVLRQPDGKYVVGGLVGASSPQNYAVARYNANGLIDSSFGASSSVPGTTTITGIAGATFATYGIARQPDGAILLAGPTQDASFNTYAAVVRLTSAGLPDPTFDGDGVRLYTAPGTPAGQTNGSDIAVTADGKILVAGYTFGATVDFVAMQLQSGLDVTPPTVTSAAFEFSNRQQVRITLSEDVLASVDLNDLVLRRLDSPGQSFAPLFLNATGAPGMPTVATWVYGADPSSLLPDGNYRATLPAGSVQDAAGNPLAADFTIDFFVLAGDPNHDRKVDFSDLVVLAQNYNTPTGATFDKGDFNYDGQVDFADLVILAQRYGTTLAAPALSVPEAIAPVRPARAASLAKNLFSLQPIKRPLAKIVKPIARRR
jgi:uncharacterized delta-60 repeat protein